MSADKEREEFRSYVWGAGLALVLTLLAFALVQQGALPRLPLLAAIGALALLQMLVHFRFFLNIRFSHKPQNLRLILFSTLLVLIMVGGTVWIMVDLTSRMMLMQP